MNKFFTNIEKNNDLEDKSLSFLLYEDKRTKKMGKIYQYANVSGWFYLVIKRLWGARSPPRGEGGCCDRIMGVVCLVLITSWLAMLRQASRRNGSSIPCIGKIMPGALRLLGGAVYATGRHDGYCRLLVAFLPQQIERPPPRCMIAVLLARTWIGRMC